MRIFIPLHLDGDNRGCEAITKGTVGILGCSKEQIIAYSRNVKLDKVLEMDRYVTLRPQKSFSFMHKFIRKVRNLFVKEDYQRRIFDYKQTYGDFMKSITAQDVVLSTGGDMLCYTNNEVIYMNEYLHRRGIKTILWGCSVGTENLNPEKMNTLKHFSMIYARETLTQKVLLEQQLKNVRVLPDPAFILEPEECVLPECFKNDVVGLNLSNYVLGGTLLNTRSGEEVIALIDYILQSTQLTILLLPHVLWKGQDDRIVSSLVYERYKETNRIFLFDSSAHNYCQIRFCISRCRFFIGARTHSVISAYSTYVPTLALGYSIKSQGIAKDLGLPRELVVDCVNLKGNGLIKDSFRYMFDKEDQIKRHLQKIIPEYKDRLNHVEIL